MFAKSPELATGVVHGAVKRWQTPKGYDRLDIHPGGIYFGPADKRAHTLLGSCVSIVLTHTNAGLAGISHFVVADTPPTHLGRANARYAPDVLLLFARACRLYNVSIEQCEARLFGGGNLLMKRGIHHALLSDEPVGDRNVARAYELLTRYGVSIKVADVGEMGYRKLIFDMAADEVWVKLVANRFGPGSEPGHSANKQSASSIEYF